MGCVSTSSSCKIMAMKLKLKEIHILSGASDFLLTFNFPTFSIGGQLADQFISPEIAAAINGLSLKNQYAPCLKDNVVKKWKEKYVFIIVVNG